jgi:hypothetical protein
VTPADRQVLGELAALQALRAGRAQQQVMEALRAAQAARRAADQAQAMLANRHASWQRRFAAEPAGPDRLANARTAIRLAWDERQRATEHEAACTRLAQETRQAHARAEAAAEALRRMQDQAQSAWRKVMDRRAMANFEDEQTVRATR